VTQRSAGTGPDSATSVAHSTAGRREPFFFLSLSKEDFFCSCAREIFRPQKQISQNFRSKIPLTFWFS
jgi:hypothetical protein